MFIKAGDKGTKDRLILEEATGESPGGLLWLPRNTGKKQLLTVECVCTRNKPWLEIWGCLFLHHNLADPGETKGRLIVNLAATCPFSLKTLIFTRPQVQLLL